MCKQTSSRGIVGRRVGAIAGMAACGLLLTLAAPAWSYNRLANNQAWPASVASAGVPYVVGKSGAPGVGYQATATSVQAAMVSWSAPSCTYLRTTFEGSTTITDWAEDGTNVLAWRSMPPDVGNDVIAATEIHPYGGRTTTDSDIMFNTYYDWSTNATGEQMDIQGIATHELGHYFGLDHSNASGSIMGPYAGSGAESVALRTLGRTTSKASAPSTRAARQSPTAGRRRGATAAAARD